MIATRETAIKTELLHHIERIEETLKDELTSTKKQVNIKIKVEVDILSSYKNAVKNWKAVIDNVLEHGSEQHCLIEIDKIEPEVSKLEGKLNDLIKNIKTVSVLFSPSSSIDGFIENTKTLGGFKVDEAPNNLFGSKVDFQTGNIRIVKIIDVCNGGGCSSGIFVGECLLFTVRSKKKVIKYSGDGKSLLSELALQCEPQDIAMLTIIKVAVSSSKNVVYIVDKDKMTLLQTLTLPELPVYGLCVVNEDQFITGSG